MHGGSSYNNGDRPTRRRNPGGRGAPLDPTLWRRILTKVRLQSPMLNRKWFDKLRPQQLTGGVILVHCQDIAQLNFLQAKCQAAFSEAAQQATDRLVSVSFHCENLPTGGVFTEADEPLPLSPDHTFEEFVVGPCNRLAHAAAQAVADKPGTGYNPLFIHGRVGLGKTHLLQALCQTILSARPNARILYLSCEAFISQYIAAVAAKEMAGFRNKYRHVDVLVIDDVHFLASHEHTQEEFFHTFNALWQLRKQIVFSADCPPKEIPELEERIVSRFNWGMVARIDKPGYETRLAIVKKKAQIRGLELPDDVIPFVAARYESNIREIEGALTTLQGLEMVEEGPLTLDVVREALGGEPVENKRALTLPHIIDAVIDFYGVKLQDLQGKRRNRSIAWPRQVCMFLARKHCRYSLGEIGGFFGNRDHTTVIHADRVVKQRLETDKSIAAEIEQIEARLDV